MPARALLLPGLAAAFLAAAPALSALHAREARLTALVVGCDYEGTPLELPSPVADARRMAAALEKPPLGFSVELLLNPTREELEAAVAEFGAALAERKGPGLFYFSGHGAQLDGENYLVPHRAELRFREDLAEAAYPVSEVTERFAEAGNGTNLLFLDACRDCPLDPRPETEGGRPRSRAAPLQGLAQLSGSGLLVGFAADSGKVAFDSGAGSHYTNALLDHLHTPGISVADLLTRVRQQVRETTGGRQEPFVYMGLDEIFAMVPAEIPGERAAAAAPVAATLTLDKNRYRDGEIPVVTVKAERDCHFALFYEDASGGMTQLFPNEFMKDDRLRAGVETVLMPSANPDRPGERIAIQIYGPPFGREHFILVAAEGRSGVVEPPTEETGPFPAARPRAARIVREFAPVAADAPQEEFLAPASASGVGTARVTVTTLPAGAAP